MAIHRKKIQLPALRWNAAAGGLLLVALFAGIAGGERAGSPPPTAQVRISNFAFGPSTLAVPVGTTVTWVNQDDEIHTVTSAEGKFTSPALETDDSFSFHFDAPGTYAYRCAIHPHMTGSVVVQ